MRDIERITRFLDRQGPKRSGEKVSLAKLETKMSKDTSGSFGRAEPVLMGLGQKADSFCVHYTTLGAETFGRAERSAIAAGYGAKSARNRGTALLKKPEVRARISELHDVNMRQNFLTTAKVLNDLEAVRIQAVERNDLAAAIRASELQGKHLMMFSERMVLAREEPERQCQLDESERREATMLATLRLRLPMSPVFELPGNSSETGEKQGESNGTDTPLQALLTDGQDAAGKVASPPEQARRAVPLFTPRCF